MITAPNACFTGSGGFGKSATVKTYVWRSSILTDAHRRGRFISILDPKGEWVRLAADAGLDGGRPAPRRRTRGSTRSTRARRAAT